MRGGTVGSKYRLWGLLEKIENKPLKPTTISEIVHVMTGYKYKYAPPPSIISQAEIDPSTLENIQKIFVDAIKMFQQGNPAAAEKIIEELKGNAKAKAKDYIDLYLSTHTPSAISFANKGEYDRASTLFEDCVNLRKLVLGDDHPDTLQSLSNLAILFANNGEYDRALPSLKIALTYGSGFLMRTTQTRSNHSVILLPY